jgi:hypothetical protein
MTGGGSVDHHRRDGASFSRRQRADEERGRGRTLRTRSTRRRRTMAGSSSSPRRSSWSPSSVVRRLVSQEGEPIFERARSQSPPNSPPFLRSRGASEKMTTHNMIELRRQHHY